MEADNNQVFNSEYNQQLIDDNYIEQYRISLESIEKVSEKRQNANSYFLTINTGICIAFSYLFSKDYPEQFKALNWIIPIAGILLSYFWLKLVKSYRQLNTAKFEVLHKIEKKLPIFLYTSEWKVLGEGKNKDKYTPLTSLEKLIPICFIIIYIATIICFIISLI